MILAAADYAEDKISAPPIELKYAWQAHSYNTLPNAGGLRDQPAGLLLRMAASYNAWNAIVQFKSANFDPKWIKNHSDQWQIITEIEKLRAEINEAKEGNK